MKYRNNLQPKKNPSVNANPNNKNTRICPCIFQNLVMKMYFTYAYALVYIGL